MRQLQNIVKGEACMKVFKPILVLFCSLSAGMLFTTAFAQDINKTKNRIAIEGYDVTAYFTEHKPVKGISQFNFEWGGAIWHFASANGLSLFRENPQKYAPQYGGYCSNGLSDGHKVGADPRNWRIIDGKLYLFFSQYGRDQWSGKVKSLMQSAEETWQVLKKE